ncbi:MAG TPA: hypothetical protein VFD70_04385 [Anaerolineae bacterium]|nr:hypothetical protein [Anaerolineae bacterium]
MAKNAKHEAAIPNPALKPWSILVGEWETVGKHRLVPDTLHGHASFEWLEGGAFLMMYSEIDEPGVPTGIAIFGSDDATKEFFMLYFDERGVSRKYEAMLRDNIWTYWRNAPGFSQRFTGTIADEGNTIIGVSELSEDDATWKRDLELTFTRVK